MSQNMLAVNSMNNSSDSGKFVCERPVIKVIHQMNYHFVRTCVVCVFFLLYIGFLEAFLCI